MNHPGFLGAFHSEWGDSEAGAKLVGHKVDRLLEMRRQTLRQKARQRYFRNKAQRLGFLDDVGLSIWDVAVIGNSILGLEVITSGSAAAGVGFETRNTEAIGGENTSRVAQATRRVGAQVMAGFGKTLKFGDTSKLHGQLIVSGYSPVGATIGVQWGPNGFAISFHVGVGAGGRAKYSGGVTNGYNISY